ncbi:MAG TPA: PDR/VanB family oxidoreductase [Rhizobium sp.]
MRAEVQTDLLDLEVAAIRKEADGILSFELVSPHGNDLPAFTAGSHLDVVLPIEIERSYSLVNQQGERHRYVIAVGRDANSRGGSAHMCEVLRVGDQIKVRPPRNTFPLNEHAANSVLIAGGIGVTPILSMAQRLAELEKSFQVFYAARTRSKAPFLRCFRDLTQNGIGKFLPTFDQEPGGTMLDLASIVSGAAPNTHFYCCGPAPMLAAFGQASADINPDNVHVEFFTATEAPAKGGFDIVLAKSGRSFFVPAEKTILETLLDAGMNIPRSCMEGVCGTCETYVLEGIPDHRDAVLSKRERASNSKMMICCSGALTDKLVLDL